MKRMMMGCLSSKRPLAQDAFNRANGALGTADLGGAWVANNATVTIVSNKAKGGQDTFTNAATLVISQLDYDVSVDVAWFTGEVINVLARCAATGIADYMGLRYDGSALGITRRLANGTPSVLASQSYSWTSGDTHRLRFSCSGNLFKGYADGVEIVSISDDNSTKTRFNAGFSASKSGVIPSSTFDNFLVMG